MELLLNQCLSSVDTASAHWKRTHEFVNEMGQKHVQAMDSLVRNASESNEQHGAEISFARAAAEEDAAKNSENIIQQFDNISEHERESISGIMATVEAQTNTLQTLQENLCGRLEKNCL